MILLFWILVISDFDSELVMEWVSPSVDGVAPRLLLIF